MTRVQHEEKHLSRLNSKQKWQIRRQKRRIFKSQKNDFLSPPDIPIIDNDYVSCEKKTVFDHLKYNQGIQSGYNLIVLDENLLLNDQYNKYFLLGYCTGVKDRAYSDAKNNILPVLNLDKTIWRDIYYDTYCMCQYNLGYNSKYLDPQRESNLYYREGFNDAQN
jgi:hypothetical protein